uniref:KIB1-4 beta-propeller domain-containing protein n=1 Tax=Leersia perrieri TaxID=77586 RepID=A0A0D9WZ57_9ORYZ
MSSAWSDLVGLVIACLPFPADRARFRAVCRTWHSAVSRHVAAAPQLPWIVLPDGTFVTVSNGGGVHHMNFPDSNAICVGSTDGWLALHRTDVDGAGTKRHTFFLHNPFTGATVPLAELGTILDDSFFETFSVCKVIVRSSGPDGGGHHLVAVMTDNWHCPSILCRPGKGTWTPEPRTMPFVRVIDITFIGDKLYLITKALDLFALDLVDDEDGRPTVTNIERIIRHPRRPDDSDSARFKWSDTEDENDDDVDNGHAQNNDGAIDDVGLYNNEDDYDDEAINEDDQSDDDEQYWNPEGVGWTWSYRVDKIEEVCNEINQIIATWNLIESGGRLLMVRREWLVAGRTPTENTREVDVFEADIDGGVWVPVTGGLGGHAIFQSEVFCKSVPAPAHGEIEGDVLYFVDTQDVWDMSSGGRKPFKGWTWVYELGMTWLFPPELVV